jgi:uncharacterized membrane protein
MKKPFLAHTRTYIFRGLLAIIPLALSVFAVLFLYNFIDKKVMDFIDRFIQVRQIPGLGILLLVFLLYLIGLIVSNVVGRQFFMLIERISVHIPIVKVIYQVGKQVSDSFSISGKKAFKKALLLDLVGNGNYIVCYVIGIIKDKTSGEEFLNVFIPTTPTPTAGFNVLVKESQTIDPGWSVEEAFKMALSAGLVSPSSFERQKI